jgi:tetratricopeptide (TPR) repeat protein
MMALVELDFGPRGKPERARELAKLARAAAPYDQQVAAQLGHQLLGAGDFSPASTMLADAVRAFPDRPEILFDLARSYYGLGRVADAEGSLATALGPNGPFPGRKQAERMATLLAAARQPAARETDLLAARETLAEEATNVPALMVLALDWERQKKYQEAAGQYERILKIAPQFAPAMRQLAILNGDQLGDDEKAEQYAQKARQTLTEDAELEYQLGAITYRRKDYAGAVRYLQQSLRWRANHAETLFFLGMAHFQLKNPTEARVELQKAMEFKLSPQEETEAKRVLDLINREGGL